MYTLAHTHIHSVGQEERFVNFCKLLCLYLDYDDYKRTINNDKFCNIPLILITLRNTINIMIMSHIMVIISVYVYLYPQQW